MRNGLRVNLVKGRRKKQGVQREESNHDADAVTAWAHPMGSSGARMTHENFPRLDQDV